MSPAAAAAMKHSLAPHAGPVYWFVPGFSASGWHANYGRWAVYFSWMSMGYSDTPIQIQNCKWATSSNYLPIFVLLRQIQWNVDKCSTKVANWLDSNTGPLLSEATTTGLFLLNFVLSREIQLTVIKWLVSNPGPLLSETTTLLTVPQPSQFSIPNTYTFVFYFIFS